MPTALLRKLTDVTSGEDLAEIKELLEANRINVVFQIHTRNSRSTRHVEYDFYRVFVRLGHLTEAKRILMERHLRIHPEDAPQALFAKGQEILKEREGR